MILDFQEPCQKVALEREVEAQKELETALSKWSSMKISMKVQLSKRSQSSFRDVKKKEKIKKYVFQIMLPLDGTGHPNWF